MEKHEIYGRLRFEFDPLEAKMQPSLGHPKPRVALEDGIYITHLGVWLKPFNLEGKKVKITVQEV